jgi:NADP-dependent 3-hydroxy acid dehydrogenase YdfG
VADIEAMGVDVPEIQLAVSDRGAVYESADQSEGHFGRVDFLVKNAVRGDAGTQLDQISDEFVDWLIDVNLRGSMHGVKGEPDVSGAVR